MFPRNLESEIIAKAKLAAASTLTAGGTLAANVKFWVNQVNMLPRFKGGIAAVHAVLNINTGETGTIKVDVIHDDSTLDADSEVLATSGVISLIATTPDMNIAVPFAPGEAKANIGIRVTATFSRANTDTMVINYAGVLAYPDQNMTTKEAFLLLWEAAVA